MKFEYDYEKSIANKVKHGIDFEDAQALWSDPFMLEAPAKLIDEPRYLAIGIINKRHWTAVFTYRGDLIRIISVRRSRKNEVTYYENI